VGHGRCGLRYRAIKSRNARASYWHKPAWSISTVSPLVSGLSPLDTYFLKYRETPSRCPPMATRPHLGVESFHIMVPSTHLLLGLRARPLLISCWTETGLQTSDFPVGRIPLPAYRISIVNFSGVRGMWAFLDCSRTTPFPSTEIRFGATVAPLVLLNRDDPAGPDVPR
jgi:hypothetical protein